MINSVIDQAWASMLASVLKNRDISRVEIGDEVDLYIPQSRLLSLVESNPDIPRLLYSSAQESARRNAGTIVNKLGMPSDYFWKFEYWPKARAFSTLEKIVTRIFASIMSQAKEGSLKITELDVEPLRINISFGECAECAGITDFEYGICYYHAGTLSGILSSLINRDLDSFETNCHASGGDSCDFTIGDKTEEFTRTGYETYISPPVISADLAVRLEKSLNNIPVRALGNMVDVSYLQLAMANTLLSDTENAALSSYEVGSQLGHRLAPVLAAFYGHEGLQNMGDYYFQLGVFTVEMKGDKSRLELNIKECAVSAGAVKAMEMTSFLTGELQGLTSELTGMEMKLEESRFEDDNLLLTFVPAG